MESENKGTEATVKTSNREYKQRYFFSMLLTYVPSKQNELSKLFAATKCKKTLTSANKFLCCCHTNNNVKLVQG
jgi:hypothetical protein